jgi:hypothetical protein
MRLLEKWDFQCLLCGHTFKDISSVTFEHITPKSLGGKKSKKRRDSDHFAPTHYNCNQFRQNFSLCRAMRLIDRQRKRMGEEQFYKWINKSVPNRIISPELIALGRTVRPDNDVSATVFGVSLPEWVPGLPG